MKPRKEKAYCRICGLLFKFHYSGMGAKRSICDRCKQKKEAKRYATKIIHQVEYLEEKRK